MTILCIACCVRRDIIATQQQQWAALGRRAHSTHTHTHVHRLHRPGNNKNDKKCTQKTEWKNVTNNFMTLRTFYGDGKGGGGRSILTARRAFYSINYFMFWKQRAPLTPCTDGVCLDRVSVARSARLSIHYYYCSCVYGKRTECISEHRSQTLDFSSFAFFHIFWIFILFIPVSTGFTTVYSLLNIVVWCVRNCTL